MAIVGFGSILYASTVGPLLNASLLVLSLQFNKSIGDITLISGYQLIVVSKSVFRLRPQQLNVDYLRWAAPDRSSAQQAASGANVRCS